MAIFTSERLANGGLPVHGSVAGAVQSATAEITIPNGTAIASGDVFRFLRVDPRGARITNVRVETSRADTGTSIAATGGVAALRPTRDPRKAFNATTNPYITGALSADVTVAFASAADLKAILESATGGNRNTAPTTASLASLDGVFDVGFTLTTSPAGNPAADRTFRVTIEYIAPEETKGEFSGINVYDYLDDSSN
jgi:hypothetical protein